ncbi:MAG: TetR/AcrR family transcriptional regulator, partial [Leeuwenhoekiella sp.]
IYRVPDFKASFKSYLHELHRVLFEKLTEARNNHLITNTNLKEITEVIFALIDGAYYYLGMFDETEESYREKVAIYTRYSLGLLTFSS